MDIGDWLRSLGLGQYEAAFRENEINEQVLPRLTQENLKEIGVGPVGHRRILLEAITALREESRPSNAAAASGSGKRDPGVDAPNADIKVAFDGSMEPSSASKAARTGNSSNWRVAGGR
ncbi:SAM domain-containing protein [Bradyrhizobium jicamae]|uniref:SAM domain-containing protein n=1 Tax=Bradyrhizobium jicamae TaxID=280332 RepID=UPI001BACEDC9|nr:hypothetical protein [Bradyrhizobium jicamae]